MDLGEFGAEDRVAVVHQMARVDVLRGEMRLGSLRVAELEAIPELVGKGEPQVDEL